MKQHDCKTNAILCQSQYATMHARDIATVIFTARRKVSFVSVVCDSANPSACHTPVFCQNEGTQMDAVFTVE